LTRVQEAAVDEIERDPIGAGLVYGLSVFSIGFVPGAIRTLLVVVAQVLFAVFPYIRLPRLLQAEGSCNS